MGHTVEHPSSRPNARPERLTEEDRRRLRIVAKGNVHDSTISPSGPIAEMVKRGWLVKVAEYRAKNWERWGLTREYTATPLARRLADGPTGQDEASPNHGMPPNSSPSPTAPGDGRG